MKPTVPPGPHLPIPGPLPIPVIRLSPQRVSKTCLAKHDPSAVLDCWLTEHSNVASALAWYDPSLQQSGWKDWPGWLTDELHQHFREMVEWYSGSMLGTPPSPFPMPLVTGLAQEPQVNGPRMMGYTARNVYLSYVANSLAAELTGAFPWSITTYTDQELHWLLHWNDLLQYRGPSISLYPGYYLMSGTSPATPGFVVAFFQTQSLIGADALDTVSRFVAWERCLWHYFMFTGESSYSYANFWGPNAPPIPASAIVDGTPYTGPEPFNPPLFAHFTAGCGGTTAFMKSVLRALNIPVDARSCGKSAHQTPFFPTIDRGLSHGDDPYDTLGVVSPFPGWPVPAASEYLTTGVQWNQWFGPNVDATTCDRNVGRRIADLAIQYQSDDLLKAYCQDQATQASHANGAVLQALSANYGLADLEAMHLWSKLAAKATSTSFCNLPQSG